jgi:formylglycine-generating enzyme required for sulfatase activity
MPEPAVTFLPQSSNQSSGLATLIACLKKAGVDWDGENIADLLWLASYVDAPAQPEDLEKTRAKAEAEVPEPVRVEIDDSEPAPLPAISPELALYGQAPNQPEQKPRDPSRSGIPFQTPTAPALRKTLALGRSLRPLMRKVDSYTRLELDENATAEQMAERQFCLTVVKPARDRWLELALVIEDSASSFLWRETIRDFQQVLERQGAFRTVTTWYLQTTAVDDIKLWASRPQGNEMPRSRSPKELLEASGRRLILLVSDCISPAWQRGVLRSQYLNLWAKHGPLVIVQMLPARLWRRTALSEGLKVALSARSPGVPNSQLVSPALADWEDKAKPGLKLPVITLEPASVSQWARMLAGFGEAQATGIWFEPDEGERGLAMTPAHTVASARAESADTEGVAEQLVSRFSKTATPMARELAALMALVPVNLSLIYLIQAKLLPDSTPLHVAEIFLSGLVQRVDEPDSEGKETAVGGSFFVTERRYDFVPSVRDILIDTVETPAAEAVLNEISIYIGQRIGKSIYSFTALLRLKDELGEAGEEFLEFATVTKQALRRLGGEYAALVDDIERPEVPGPVPPDPRRRIVFPPLELLEFTKGELIDGEDDTAREPESNLDIAFPPPLKTASFQIATVSLPQQTLEVFEFETAKIERDRTGLLRRLQWVVKKSRAQARKFVELLADDLTLEMVAIPGGRFQMGSPKSELERSPAEGQHGVTVPDFLMGRYPVTQAQWRFVANLPQVNRGLDPDPSAFKGSRLPVERVSWHDATEFCDRLSANTERIYRLPTEAEWEYACRAGTGSPFHFGNTLTTEVANCNGNDPYAAGPKGNYRGKTTPVDQFNIANTFGLAEMHGNVWEWCQDHYGSYDQTPRDGNALLTYHKKARRIVRGGCWGYFPRNCRSASRYDFTPDIADSSVGFRVSCSVPSKPFTLSALLRAAP